MRRITFVICFICFGLTLAQGQKKNYSKISKSGLSLAERIEMAMQLSQDDPSKAVKSLNRIILDAKAEEKHEVIAQSYYLLGNIYNSIGQELLAIERYNQGLNAITTKSFEGSNDYPDSKSRIYEKLAAAYLNNKDMPKAKMHYNLCIEWAVDESVKLKCFEGLADFYLKTKQYEKFEKQQAVIENDFELDSIALVRKEARMTEYYLLKDKISEMNISFQNSVNVLKKGPERIPAEVEAIQQSQTMVLNSSKVSPLVKLESQRAIVEYAEPVNDPFKLDANYTYAELFEEENDIGKAKKYIDVSKSLITSDIDPNTASKVFRKSADINKKSGLITEALSDFDKYIEQQEKALEKQKIKEERNLQIMREQKLVDISQQAFDYAQKEKSYLQSQIANQKLIIGLLGSILVGTLAYFFILSKNIKDKKIANQKLRLQSLTTQMNPHFIFNALNSVNNFIAKNDEKSANKYLSEFSMLMRKVLDYSKQDFVSFEEELELNELYVKLEHFRFREQFDYNIIYEGDSELRNIDVPPMIIQPLIENAVWHGLRYKEEKGQLDIVIVQSEKSIEVHVKDNGIGRTQSMALKTKNQRKHKSTGLSNVKARLDLLNEVYNKNYKISVSNLSQNDKDSGTFVKLTLPLH